MSSVLQMRYGLIDDKRNRKKMSYLTISTAPADELALLDDRAYADTVMTKLETRIYTELVL